MSNVATVQEIYEAFGRGDIPAILQRLAEDVRWEHHPTGNTAQDHDVPYMRPRSGRDAVAGFFQDIGEDFEMHSFSPHTFLEGEGLVAAVIESTSPSRPPGSEYGTRRSTSGSSAPRARPLPTGISSIRRRPSKLTRDEAGPVCRRRAALRRLVSRLLRECSSAVRPTLPLLGPRSSRLEPATRVGMDDQRAYGAKRRRLSHSHDEAEVCPRSIRTLGLRPGRSRRS